MKKLMLIFPVFLALLVNAQLEHEITDYEWPTDQAVLDKLEDWQDLKFGLLMHWGAYSQWGIVESWSICPEDYGWCERKKGSNPNDYFTYKKEYENLKLSFNPTGFNPEDWAKAAADAGMKYLVFTTKHHDGFCMFDSKYTDYKITSPESPFSTNPKANIAKEVFDAFRNEGLWAGAYFSKPDWNSPYYWDPKFPPMDRNVNYDPAVYPEKWEKFVQFTQNQIMELMSDYGKIDILWLDGGWVSKKSPEQIKNYYNRVAENATSGFPISRAVNQDIRMDEIAAKAREKQPGLIVVDRAVKGPNQNYLTPENKVPETQLPYPWESCIIAGGGWSWVPDAVFMTPKQAIHMLIDIVAKGGNLLYNIAPGPDGRWPEGAYKLLAAMGDWIDVNGEAIYSTRAIAPYKTDNICLSQQKDTKAVYALYLEEEDGSGLPESFTVKGIKAAKNAQLTLLGAKGNLKWQNTDEGVKVTIPSSIRKNLPCDLAWAVKISAVE
ncbi:alpha-L-fucosidase [Draconibacterium orientale]|uniref:alpha-L-fucosidase n=1 Tax=Draconibacterium orientale TaxID=1168034 RepID=X5D8M8_9BACT|nr:alpha-L-fucosidase [Draconibacterium orientale]AHW59098.1 alpha-L-fucosidase [Draconibacterium orientale]SET58293.1 alpha-L-fucosidase [Draconibacterium orientale]